MMSIAEIIRREFGKGDAIRDAGLTTPEDVQRFDDIVYGQDPQWQVMDLYRPKGVEGKLPVIISFHGGGWVYGDKGVYQYYCMSLAQRGFAVLNFTYRLAPESTFPAPLEDMNAVVRWALNNAEGYGLDSDHIFAVGDSAGGHGLGLYAALTANPEYARMVGIEPPEGFRFGAVALNCGAYDMLQRDEQLKALYLPEGADEQLLQVPAWVTEAYPPTFLMTCNQDFLKSHAPLMVDALMEHNVPFELHFYSPAGVELAHVFHCDMRNPYGQICNDEECDFFRKQL